ncbi:MAG: trypsin-like peptidase domain-containing protein [Terriglobia bacterium]
MKLSRQSVTILVAMLWIAATAAAQAPAPKQAPSALSAMSQSFEALAERVSPAVVQVVTAGFGAAEGPAGPGTAVVAPQSGAGSGVIVDPAGYIVTNSHVVEGARRVEVLLAAMPADKAKWRSILKPRGKLVPAQIVGVDRETDLAVLKIQEEGLSTLEWGNSDDVRQGQLVMAFGSPLGLENSVTLGVVSSVARQLRPDDPMIYIQTDAPINPGNSGGPLVDTEGRVVGINTLILSQSGGSEGIGLAAPSNIVRHVFEEIRKQGRVRRGQIGVEAQTVTPLLAAGLGLPQDWGVILADVTPRGPADVAGLKIGDLVLTLEDKLMENARQLDVNLYTQPVGSIVTLQIQRGTERFSKQVAVLERPNDPDRLADLIGRETQPVPKLGILAVKLDGRIAQILPPPRKLSGVVAISLLAEAPLAGQYFLPGDIIYAVNQEPVADVESLDAALAKRKTGEVIVMQVERQQKLRFVAFKMP